LDIAPARGWNGHLLSVVVVVVVVVVVDTVFSE
jgi:hypothetical protein